MRARCRQSAVLALLLVSIYGCGGGSSASAPSSGPLCTPTFAYVTNLLDNTVSIYTVNPCTGNLTPTTPDTIPTGNGPFGMAVDPSAKFAYVINVYDSTVSMYTVNSSTGNLTPTTPPTIATGVTPEDVIVDPSGKFVYVTSRNNNTVSMYTINRSTGLLTPNR